jgi:hypothetical protein
MTTVKVKIDKKLYDLVIERLPGLGYESPEDFARHAVELRFETLLGLIAATKPKTRELPVDDKTYAELKTYADKKGLTVEAYLEKLVMENDLSEL